jgi:hypothetical protein
MRTIETMATVGPDGTLTARVPPASLCGRFGEPTSELALAVLGWRRLAAVRVFPDASVDIVDHDVRALVTSDLASDL